MKKIITLLLLVITSTAINAQLIAKTNWIGKFNDGNAIFAASNTILDIQCNSANGDVYVLGQFKDSLDLDLTAVTNMIYNTTTVQTIETYLALYNKNGQLQWGKVLIPTGGGSFYGDIPSKMAILNNNIYVVGTLKGIRDFDPGPNVATLSSSNFKAFIAKYDLQGKYIAVNKHEGTGYSFYTSISVNPNSNAMCVAGYYGGSVDFDWTANVQAYTGATNNLFIQNIEVGTFSPAELFNISGPGTAYEISVAEDKDGGLYAAGYFSGKLNFGGTLMQDSLDTDSPNTFQGFILKLNFKFNKDWINLVKGATGNKKIFALAPAFDSVGNIKNLFFAGSNTGNILFGKDSTTAQAITSAAGMFIAQINTQGQFGWINAYPTNLKPHSIEIIKRNATSIATGNALVVSIEKQVQGAVDFNLGTDTAIVNVQAQIFTVLDTTGNFKWLGYNEASLSANSTINAKFMQYNNDSAIATSGSWQGNLDCNSEPGQDSIITSQNVSTYLQSIAAKVKAPTALAALQTTNITLAPNPSFGSFNITTPLAATCTIYNVQGKQLFAKAIQIGNNNLNLNLNSGLYIAVISTSNSKVVKQLIIQ